MKRSFIVACLLCITVSLWAGVYTPQTVPNPKQWGQEYYVSNPDGILSAAVVDTLNMIASFLEEESGVEMAIVVLGSFRLSEEEQPNTCDLFRFNYELFNLWGIGDAETNRGLLITVSYDSHQMFISTGTALDSELPDATCLYIQNKIILPHFKEDDYDQGLMDGAIAIYGYFTDEEMKSNIDEASSSSDDNDLFSVIMGLIVLAAIVFLRRKIFGGGGGYSGGGYSGGRSSSGGFGHSSGSWGGGTTSGGGAGSRW